MGRAQRFNVNDNEWLKKKKSMSMTMTLRKGLYGVRDDPLPEAEVDDLADCLVKMFNAPGSKPLYCDAVRYLERAYLDEKSKYALSHARTTPAKLFGAIIFRQLVKAGVYPRKA